MEPYHEEDSRLFLNRLGEADLFSAAFWTKIIALAALVGVAIFIVYAIAAVMLLPQDAFGFGMVRGVVIFIYAIIALVGLIPYFFLLKFSNAVRRAIRLKDAELLNRSFSHLKIYAIILGVYILLGIVMVIFSLLMFATMTEGLRDFNTLNI
jgi:hypothetical protein